MNKKKADVSYQGAIPALTVWLHQHSTPHLARKTLPLKLKYFGFAHR
jgi:hypothetical protein